ncbi:proline dehydrogenase [Actinosynnema sp. NPDC020468]|uniref:proline dehydrogenase n=1 Tax=Actinosynnema sp. NPDC020468 TaxID=3154488 RepID=UPI0033CD640D
MTPLRSSLLAAAGSDAVRRAIAGSRLGAAAARRLTAGPTTSDAVDAAGDLVEDGFRVVVELLGEPGASRAAVERTVREHLALLDSLHLHGLGADVEVAVTLPALGSALAERVVVDSVSRVCAAADQCGTAVTIDSGDHTTGDLALRVLAEVRRHWPSTGIGLYASSRAARARCAALSGTRVRLSGDRGAEPASVAFVDPHEVDLSYVRCANALLAGSGRPVFATDDPRLTEIVAERAQWYGRAPGSFEFLARHGVRATGRLRLVAEGHSVRVRLPYGAEWYGYLVRTLVERPAFVAAALVGRF